MLFGILFAVLNYEQVQINYYFGTSQIPLALMLVLFLVIGALFAAFASIGMVLKYKRQIMKLRREAKNTEREVTNLRSIPIKDEF